MTVFLSFFIHQIAIILNHTSWPCTLPCCHCKDLKSMYLNIRTSQKKEIQKGTLEKKQHDKKNQLIDQLHNLVQVQMLMHVFGLFQTTPSTSIMALHFSMLPLQRSKMYLNTRTSQKKKRSRNMIWDGKTHILAAELVPNYGFGLSTNLENQLIDQIDNLVQVQMLLPTSKYTKYFHPHPINTHYIC